MSTMDLLSTHEPDQVVAFGGDGDKTAAELLADGGRIAAALPETTPGSHVLLVLDTDRYTTAAALLGTLARGHSVALAPNGRRDSILAVSDRPETVAVIHDTDAGLPFRIQDLLRDGRDAPPLAAPFVPTVETMATVFTSGTTGPMTAWRKSPRELIGEARMLGRSFGIGRGDRIVGTVSPGHIYGLLFTVLLPLARGAAFCRETPLHAAAIAHCVDAHAASVLVSVPVALRACNALPMRAFPSLQRVFSSTGPLPANVARDFRARHDHPITEVLGSTETGGIATRERRGAPLEEDERWRPLEGVRVSLGAHDGNSGRLRVDSPFIHADLPLPFETQDLVRLNDDGSFTHVGRADDIVKIGGRRVSVQEVEECIRLHEEVGDAAVAAVPAPGGRGHQLLAAVAPATVPVAGIRKVLLKHFEPTCLPRRILCVDSLPKEANGKMPRARLLRLFNLREDGQPIAWSPVWGDTSLEADGSEIRFEAAIDLPEGFAWFDGHFDQFPVLAGAVQLKELLLPAADRAFPDLGRLRGLSRVKFLQPIGPGARLTVRLRRAAGSHRVRFEIEKRGDAPCSTGQLIFEDDAGEASP